jgi:hypothetical protein
LEFGAFVYVYKVCKGNQGIKEAHCPTIKRRKGRPVPVQQSLRVNCMSTINVTSATAQGVLDIISDSKSTVKLDRQKFAVPEPHGLS